MVTCTNLHFSWADEISNLKTKKRAMRLKLSSHLSIPIVVWTRKQYLLRQMKLLSCNLRNWVLMTWIFHANLLSSWWIRTWWSDDMWVELAMASNPLVRDRDHKTSDKFQAVATLETLSSLWGILRNTLGYWRLERMQPYLCLGCPINRKIFGSIGSIRPSVRFGSNFISDQFFR